MDDHIEERLHKELSEKLTDYRNLTDIQLMEIIDHCVLEEAKNMYLPLKKKVELRMALFDSFRRLDILQELIDDKDITEIMINGTENIFVEKSGHIVRWDKRFKSNEQLEDMIQKIVSSVNRSVNIFTPIADARLEDGSRVHVVLPPISLDGPIVTIRKFPDPISMDKLIRFHSITPQAAQLLKKLVQSGYNIFISGGTNSGKTTFLNALSAYIPEDERVITIEDSAELQLMQIKNLVRLESRNANSEGEGKISIADLIKAALRMNPEPPHYKKVNIRAAKKASHHPMYTLEPLHARWHSSHLQTSQRETASSLQYPPTARRKSSPQKRTFSLQSSQFQSPGSQPPETDPPPRSVPQCTSMQPNPLQGSP